MFIRHIYLSFRRKARIANFNEQKTILLWADVSKNPIFEEYSFAKISNLKEQKRLFNNQIIFMYDKEWKK